MAEPANPIDPARLSAIVRTLASEEFEGRAPGTAGETKTIDYLSRQFAALGLEPGGENGGWTQTVPLVRTQIGAPAAMRATQGGKARRLVQSRDIYVSTVRNVDRVAIRNAPIVFVGYGVTAPERKWDDFKGADLKGKIALFLVNDPDFEAAPTDPVAGRFGGRTMTYYGRWTYKYEEAARRGAIGALIVHEAAGAGYGWDTVIAPGGGNYDIVRAPGAPERAALQGWLDRTAAADLLRGAGLDLETLKAQARRADFRPVELKATRFTADLPVTASRIDSHNVLAKLPGTKHPDETIMFAGHWDAYGIGKPDAQGRTVRAGANDDALGLAGVLELARVFAAGPRPERTLVFAAWTAEERGLLGSEAYGEKPLYPLEKTVANLTLDVLQTAGPARDVILIGKGQGRLEDDLARAAAAQGRTVSPEALPERGLFYRADHFSLARRGVPVLLLMALGGGADLVEGGRAAGDKWLADYMACYHQPCDAWSPDWDLRGAAADVALFHSIASDLANSRRWPDWHESSEFRAIRNATATKRQ
ncbi:peptidase M20 [Sphingomonas oleivorans]|uniref:Peptidase M20 n=2 Tax=Sphingomonas oleivorans TaxID=1735121 RepID=A0A2T5FX10_9SPHN|nr:M28 family metallopeptidase [Sphingomonas oleivorans]PTQ10308.1 peptidase M20 [Sphingomonas oleivorans]